MVRLGFVFVQNSLSIFYSDSVLFSLCIFLFPSIPRNLIATADGEVQCYCFLKNSLKALTTAFNHQRYMRIVVQDWPVKQVFYSSSIQNHKQ